MDKLLCASLSHPGNDNCYEVVMLKVPAYIEDRLKVAALIKTNIRKRSKNKQT